MNEVEAAHLAEKNKSAKRQPAGAAAKEASARPREARQSRMGEALAQVVAVLMRDANYRNMRLADLEWLVLPPVMAGQFRLGRTASTTEAGQTQQVPVVAVLWACVSDQIDADLAGDLDKPVRLRTDEWASGANVWLMAIAGDQRAVPHLVKQLAETEFKGRPVKMRWRAPDGKVVIKTVST